MLNKVYKKLKYKKKMILNKKLVNNKLMNKKWKKKYKINFVTKNWPLSPARKKLKEKKKEKIN